MNRIDEKLRMELRKRAENDLYFLAKGILHYDWLTKDFHLPFARFLITAPKRRGIILPRGFLKTTLGTKAFAIWLSLPDEDGLFEDRFPFRGPDVRVLISSASKLNAQKMLKEIRSHWERNALLRFLFPELIPNMREVKWNDSEFCLERPSNFGESTVEATGVSSKTASRHYDVILIDDPIDPENKTVPSKEEIDRAIEWRGTCNPLLVNPSVGVVQDCGTRWAYWDYLATVKENLPATSIFERKAIENGEATEPTRFDLDVLAEIKADSKSSEYIFASQYLNDPVPAERLVFRPEDDLTFSKLPNLREIHKYILVDPAISTKKWACRTAVVTVAVHASGSYYIDDYFVDKISPRETVDQIFCAIARAEGVQEIGIEAVSYQESLVYDMERAMKEKGMYIPVTPVRPGSNETKEMRIQALQPLHQRGQFFYREGMDDLITELRQFPLGKYVDILDAISYTPKIAITPSFFAPDDPKGNDPFLLDNILKEIEERHESSTRFPIFSHQLKAFSMEEVFKV